MAHPQVQLSLISNLWIKLMTFENAGDINAGHKHVFDHPTLLVKGRMEVDIEGEKTIFEAPHIIFIAKETFHTLTALESGRAAWMPRPPWRHSRRGWSFRCRRRWWP